MVRSSVLLEYPSESSAATLGSLVFVKFQGDDDVEPVYISGAARAITELPAMNVPEGCMIITVQSPLGGSLLGSKEGVTVSYEVNGRKLSVEVGDVIQLAPETNIKAIAH